MGYIEISLVFYYALEYSPMSPMTHIQIRHILEYRLFIYKEGICFWVI